MGSPAYQLQGNQYATNGALGTSALGTCPLGGSLYDPYEVPCQYLGSDDLRTRDRVEIAGPQHERHGVVIGQRTWAEIGRWRVIHRGLESEQLTALKTYWSARIFNLLPDGNPTGSVIPVLWRTREWNPTRVRGGRYSLEYELEERPQ
ncbi:MAG TPA: hypothetical protein PLU44_16895 [Candidatus Krumholzibacteria bacterium]|nr:hypothetical protein [Candidatus Krumholzibacteria bacterium]